MSAWLGPVVALACGYALLKLLPVVLVALQVRRLRVRLPDLHVISRADLPEHVRMLLDAANAELLSAGFEYARTYRTIPLLDGGTATYCDVYRHREEPATAVVGSGAPAGGMPYNLSFETYLADGSSRLTLNRMSHLCLPFPPQAHIEDANADSLAAMWAYHRERLAGCRVDALRDHQQIAEQALATLLAVYHYWIERGWVAQPNDPDRSRLTIAAATWLAVRAVRGARKAAAPFQSEATKNAPAQAASARVAFEQQLALAEASPRSPLSRLIVLLGSAVLAGVAFGVALSWEIVPVLLAVLALHELGHYVAMRMVGYRDVGVFFVPLLGAATAGRKDDATPMQQLFVYLAGPVPGLVLGFACLLYAADAISAPGVSAFVHQFGWMAVILNLLNLLPVSPLDGGRIVEVFLLGRFPRARFVFLLIGALAFAALAWTSIGAGYLDYAAVAIAMLLALALPFHWRTAQALLHAQQRVQMPAQRDEALRALFATLAEPPLQARPLSERVAIAKAALPTLLMRHPGPAGALLGLAIYLACTVAPVLGAGYYWLSAGTRGTTQQMAISSDAGASEAPWSVDATRDAAERQLDERLASVADAGERWQLLYDAGLESSEFDPEGAHRLFARAMEIAATFPRDDLRLARTKLQLALHAPEEQQLPALERVVADTETGGAEARLIAAQALEAIAYHLDDDKLAAIARLRAALAIREDIEPAGSFVLVNQRESLARRLDAAGEVQEAEALLRKSVGETADAPAPPAGDACRAGRSAADVCTATRPLGWFLIAHGRAAEAMPMLHAALGSAQPDYQRPQCLTVLGWAQLEAGDPTAALRSFEQAQALQLRLYEPESWWLRALASLTPVKQSDDPLLLLDAYVAARAAGNEAAATRWLGQLQTSGVDARRLVEDMRNLSQDLRWEARRYARHADALAELGSTRHAAPPTMPVGPKL